MKFLVDREELVFRPPPLDCILVLPGLPGGGSRIYDRSPYGNSGTLIGANWGSTPGGLWCPSFDGTDDYVDCGNSAVFDLASNLTIAAWIKLNASVVGGVVSKGESNMWSACPYSLRISAGTVGRFGIGNGTTGENVPTGALLVNQWYYLLGVADSGTIAIYLNGKLAGSITRTISPKIDATKLLIGSLMTGGGSQTPFNGLIAGVRLYNRALTALEIQCLFDQEARYFGIGAW